MTKVLNSHYVSSLEVDPYAPMVRWVAICSCHNPDGLGEGRADFGGDTALEALEAWLDHVDPEGDIELPDEPPMGSTIRFGNGVWPFTSSASGWYSAGLVSPRQWAECLAIASRLDDGGASIDTLAERWVLEVATWEKPASPARELIPGTLDALNALTIRSGS